MRGAAERPDPIYMDHHATTPALPEVIDAMMPFLARDFGNASSSHVFGRRAAAAVEEARARLAALVGAEPAEIVFTAGATESDNMALRGACAAAAPRARRVVTCAIEHEAVLETCHDLEREGFEVVVLPVDRDGLVDPDAVRRAIEPGAAIVSVMMANNEIGTIEPVAEIGRICRERKVPFHTDAVQAVGRIPVDARALHVDLMSLTAHKMYGPKGIGALYVRSGVSLPPMLLGGGQEGGRRSGTLNVPGIVGFGAAAATAAQDLHVDAARQAALRDRLWLEIRERVPAVELNGHPTQRLPNNLNVAFEGVEAEALLTALREVAALSSGSACASGTAKGSYVIRALGHGERRARGSIRFGLGRSNGPDDVEVVVERLEREVPRLRSLAPSESDTTAPGRMTA